MEEIPCQPVMCPKCVDAMAKSGPPYCCPSCGYDPNRGSGFEVQGTFQDPTTIQLLQRAPGGSFNDPVWKVVFRVKRSGESKLPTKEIQVYDRRDPKRSVKKHQIEEQQPNGSWLLTHDTEEEYPARHRPEHMTPEEDGS